MKKYILILILFKAFTINAQDETIETKIDALLEKMTLEEKIGQMVQYTGFYDPTGPAPKEGWGKPRYEHVKKGLVGSMLNVKGAKEVRAMQKVAVENSRLGIPMIFGLDVIHGHKTISPIPLAESASWDLEAIELSARNAAEEAAATGINWTFAPMMDLYRDARWGRVMEGGGEDTYLGTKIAVARINGFQGDDLSANNTLAACAKHYAAYGFAESGKDYNTVDVGLSTLYNVILPPFKAAVQEANVATVMNAFNELNGIPATGDEFLLRDLLKGEWGFQGFVVSDWASIIQMKYQGYAKDDKHTAEIAANAGSDMDMESDVYLKYLPELVKEGKVKEATIDDAVRRILRVKFQLGLFDDPYKYCDEQREKEIVYNQRLVNDALDMAKKSIVLLKNEKDLLPLAKEGKKIALIGQLADDKNSPLGNWRLASDNFTAISVKEGLTASCKNEIQYEQGVKLYDGVPSFGTHVKVNNTDATGIEAAVAAAKEADVVVMVLGEQGFQSGEGRSRANIGLPGLQQELLEAVYAENKNIVLVLMNGRPLAIPWADENIPAIVEAWQLGMQSGHAIAQVLFGDYNPSGKLPMSFPRAVGQVPIYYNYKKSGRFAPKGDEVFYTHYNDESSAPLYPFGFGLSYTTFKYDDLKATVNDDNTVTVNVELKNTGDRTGEEVVQLYIKDQFASVTRPVKELKGFDKVELKAGESTTVSFTLTDKELGFYNNQGKFVVEKGKFDLMVGGNSEDLLKTEFELK